jgi:uncharacterized protein YxeA
MKKIYTFLILLSIIVLSISHIYIWKDQAEMWHQLNLHIQMEKKWNRYEKATHPLGI